MPAQLFQGQAPKMGARTNLQLVLDGCRQQAIRPPHHDPVVLISRPTSQAYLIITAVFSAARPREPVRTTTSEKVLEEIQWITPWFRFFQ